MLDWGILIVCTVVVLWLLWRAYRWLRREEPEEQAVVMPDNPTLYPNLPEHRPSSIHFIPQPSADEIAQRVHEHERACERKERAEALLQAVLMGHKPDADEIEFLNEYYHGTRVNAAISTGMWSSTMKAIEDLTQELEDLKAAQPTLIVAEMPERVG